MADFARLLSVDLGFLRSVLKDRQSSFHYRKHKIPKRHSRTDFRLVWEPRTVEARELHKTLHRRLVPFLERHTSYPHPAAHGYVAGRSTLTNAQQHCSARYLLRADIKDFFETITSERIERLLLAIGLKEKITRAITSLVTIEGRLALGLNASPVIANIASQGMDVKLAALASRLQAAYTRYADDLAFSGAGRLPKRAELVEILDQEGFTLAERKYRQTTRGQAHFLTGLSVSDVVPRVPRRIKRKLRQQLFYASKYGLEEHLDYVRASSYQSYVNRTDGMIRYIHAIEPALADGMRATWTKILKDADRRVSYSPRHERPFREIDILIDESECSINGKRVLLLGLLCTEDVKTLTDATVRLARQHVADPYSAGDKASIAKRGLHFATDHDELRTDYTRVLASLPVRCYVAYDYLADESAYAACYLSLLRALIPHRLIFYDRARVRITFEQNSKIKPAEVDALVRASYADLEASSSRRPVAAPDVVKGTKESSQALAAVDYMLGILANYATLDVPNGGDSGSIKGKRPGEVQRKRFERLRDRYKLIMSRITKEHFSRKRPFTPWSSGDPGEPKPTSEAREG